MMWKLDGGFGHSVRLAGAFYKSFASNPFAIEKRPPPAIFRIQMSLMQNPNRTLREKAGMPRALHGDEWP